GGGDVAPDVLDEVQPVGLAVLGGVGDAVPDRVGDRPDPDLPAVLVDPAGDPGPVAAAEDAHRQLGAARAHQARQPHDLAAAQRQRGAVHHDAVVLGGGVDGPVLDPQHLGADVRDAGGEPLVQVAADHAGDDAVLRHVAAHVERLDRPAVPQDRGPVGDRADLVQLVRDDHAGDALSSELHTSELQ